LMDRFAAGSGRWSSDGEFTRASIKRSLDLKTSAGVC
jgi:hypothetical protein